MQKPVLKPVFIKLAGLLLLKTYDVCFWIFLAANFFQPNLVFIADSRTGFFSDFVENTSKNSQAATGTVL